MIHEQLDQMQPIADPLYQQSLEDQLIAEWYKKNGLFKRKRTKKVNLPLTFVASFLVVLILGIVLSTLPSRSGTTPLAVQDLPQATPVPTPIPVTPPSAILNDFPLSWGLDAGKVALEMQVDLAERNDLRVGSFVDISAVIERHQVSDLPDNIRQDIVNLLDRNDTDALSITLVTGALIIKDQKKMNLIVLQVSPQESVILTWLFDSRIPYVITPNVLFNTADSTATNLDTGTVAFAMELQPPNHTSSFEIGDRVQITATFDREMLDEIPVEFRDQISALFTDTDDDTVTMTILDGAVVNQEQKKINLLTLQVTAQEATFLTWFVYSQIPYKIEVVS